MKNKEKPRREAERTMTYVSIHDIKDFSRGDPGCPFVKNRDIGASDKEKPRLPDAWRTFRT